MIRRSVFADKLSEFPFVFGDEGVTSQRGRWRDYFATRTDNRVEEGSDRSPQTSSSFIPDPSSLLLEIGCYNAAFLARIAASHPNKNFIGLDWKARPLYLGAQGIAEQKLSNLALLRARAQELTTIFADGELDQIWLFHPDPFDNDRERPMRLMSQTFLLNVHRLLRAGGQFILKTDHLEYFETAIGLIQTDELSAHFHTELLSRDLWNDAAALTATRSFAFSGEKTFFETRFLRRKQPIYYLQIKRV